ncbi:MAG TPA: hypothetical protein VJU14_04465 [Solirubrobacterales bacterium]|nr:hypothetical protein [Solirubrobacterales bacterium]
MPQRAVPTLAELEARIDEALVIARASEEGVGMVGEVALDAARQARRAAEAAEESARAAKDATKAAAERVVQASSGPAGPVADLVPPSLSGWSPKSAPPPGRGAGEGPVAREVVIDPLQRFNERADAVAERLRKLERVPV